MNLRRRSRIFYTTAFAVSSRALSRNIAVRHIVQNNLGAALTSHNSVIQGCVHNSHVIGKHKHSDAFCFARAKHHRVAALRTSAPTWKGRATCSRQKHVCKRCLKNCGRTTASNAIKSQGMKPWWSQGLKGLPSTPATRRFTSHGISQVCSHIFGRIQ